MLGVTTTLYNEVIAARRLYEGKLAEFAADGDHRFRVTVFGSARAKPGDAPYEEARRFAQVMAQGNIDIITGAGPGIMEAANRGAHEAEGRKEDWGRSIGVPLLLPMEQEPNGATHKAFHTEDFCTRLELFGAYGLCHVCFTPGYGTDLERAFFGQIVQIARTMGQKGVRPSLFQMHPSAQLGYFPRIYLLGSEKWKYVDYMRTSMVNNGTISEDELGIFQIVGDVEQLIANVLEERERWRIFLKNKGVEPLN